MTLRSVDPASGETIAIYEVHDEAYVNEAIERAARAWGDWARRPLDERVEPLRRVAVLLRDEADDLGRLMAREMGKPLAAGLAEAEKCAWVCEHYAEHAAGYLRDEPAESDAERSYVSYRPLGVVLAVMPWNFPLWQVFRFAAPTLAAGNAALLKHASNVPGCALAIADLFRRAGLPDGVFTSLLVGSKRVEEIIEHPLVRAVSVTGSTPAGRAVASTAGQQLKKTVLELGGNDPYIVLADADIAAAAEACVSSRLINGGQSCIAAKRFIVERAVLQPFSEAVLAGMRAAVVGHPLAPDTTLGPLARHDLRDDLHEQVERSVAAGAVLLLGGEIPDGPGAYYPPTVLADVGPGMPAYDEELFGPVAALIGADDEEDAIRIANDTAFGLGAAVFTADVGRGERIARERLEAGACFVNAFVRSDPRLPFGGVKDSGFGRELARHGIREFVNVKTVYVA